MKLGTLLLALSLALTVVGTASAEVITGEVIYDLKLGSQDSGWSVVLADNVHTGVVVDQIGAGYVLFEIGKTFWEGPEGGEFPANIIRFVQRLDDAHTVPVLMLTSEAIANQTGMDWTDYHWQLTDGGAAFNRTLTDASGFSIEPFTNQTWGPPAGDADHALTLDVDGGIVLSGETYFPGSTRGRLYLDADLSGAEPVSFRLVQYPTPEPGTMLLLLGGSAALLGRSRRRRAAR